MFHNFLTNENRGKYNSEKNNIQDILPKDIMPKYKNIKKEIRKKARD